MIKGFVESRKVLNGATELLPDKSLKVRNHSPDGFAWGYGGSGPAQLALAILLEFTTEDIALQHYQDFKHCVIANLEGTKDFTLSDEFIKGWLVSSHYYRTKNI